MRSQSAWSAVFVFDMRPRSAAAVNDGKRLLAPVRSAWQTCRMNRVLLIGCSGAGKSMLAAEIGPLLDLPVIHLDAQRWQPGWVAMPRDEWEARVRQMVQGERWLIDGNYGGTMSLRIDAADAVVFLDLPRRTCLLSVWRRALRWYGRTRPDLSDGCPEQLPSREFLRWIWTYRRDRRPGVLAQLEAARAAGKEVIILRSRRQVRAFVGRLRASRITDPHPPDQGVVR
jgi:adenylate kinase family enzyme